MLRRLVSRRTLAMASGATALSAAGGYYYLNSGPTYPPSTKETRRPPPPWTPPSRQQMLDALKLSSQDPTQEFDLLVVGGGATGAGVAVDAASRGLKVALVEMDDFSSDCTLSLRMLPIMLPIYKYWQVPYYWAGCKMYDLLAGKENMETSYLMSKGKALEAFPMLKQDGLVGALVYYDVTSLDKKDGKLSGAKVRDVLTGKEFNVSAKGIVNATGPFSDSLLTMDNPDHKPIVQPSSGTHITLPNYYSPRTMGLLDPATSDGTTDTPAEVSTAPRAQEEEIRWILEEVRRYLSPDIRVRRGDHEGLVRNHMIHVSESGLLTIAGGKWTTYRAMAEETVDKAIEVFNLKDRTKRGCVTEHLRLIGSDGWSRNMFIGLVQRVSPSPGFNDAYAD
ncbi:uncharacterized protein BXZ73DRAFT_103540 [Epithele typhae]|uniref:uncharacterized protein n=1 Tax=Epithele typhae TaxID=378194 RepID=UPI002008E2A9|nr:uncharacterized protein BXZ73DRAFT_103540 [Epithele typhae]KAH9924699.1 hypothetical protein BXZ73DRAFT_103540 [Epithele typhae]